MFSLHIPDFDLHKIAASGQCFRLNALADGSYRLIAGGHAVTIVQRGPNALAFDCDERAFYAHWADYFDQDTDYAAIARKVPENDAYLTQAVAYGRGIRILRQDPWEMLITFIISQRKNIPAIKRAVECLCEDWGQALPGGFAFPTPEALDGQPPEALARCALGYRTRYVLAAARMVASGALDLSKIALLDDAALLEALKAVPGVGDKVANCVMLFGYHRLRAFPRDVWINRTLDAQYADGFPLALYEGCEGVMQQYLFYYARAAG